MSNRTKSEPKTATYRQAVALLARLAKRKKSLGVFVDGGWGDIGHGVERTIITDGNGQKPHARITKQTFDRLRADNLLDGNSLITFKARRYHEYIRPGEKGQSENGDRLYRDTL